MLRLLKFRLQPGMSRRKGKMENRKIEGWESRIKWLVGHTQIIESNLLLLAARKNILIGIWLKIWFSFRQPNINHKIKNYQNEKNLPLSSGIVLHYSIKGTNFKPDLFLRKRRKVFSYPQRYASERPTWNKYKSYWPSCSKL